ncbi:MAG: ABC transporter ATP-binding protein [bacterium]
MIQLIDIHKSFRNKKVLTGVNLTIHRGESMVVIGGSGCGKSVLMKHIMGLIWPDRGQVIIDGKDLASCSRQELNEVRKKFGMLFQGAALFDSMTVGQNVGFGLKEHTSLSKDEIQEKVQEKLHMVGLPGIDALRPDELSGGMKKRVGLARAIAMEPEILLYDEPTTGLDPIMSDVINDLIIRMKEAYHVTSLAITHDMISAYKIADRIGMLYEGRIIETGTPEEIQNTKNPIVRQFITGSAKGPITEGACV